MPAATVLIPTFDHGPVLSRAVSTAQAQTVADIEIFIVGDGVPDVTREIAGRLMAQDRRVRFFDNPKGPRNGELHRHRALAEARGEIVCYLSDDDLWLPDHVATMRGLLTAADFAHALPVKIEPDGEIGGWTVDLAQPGYRELILTVENRVPFSCAAHTLAMYRRLPHGWRTSPPGTPTDLHMFRQFLALPDCRAVSGTMPTVLVFPSPSRRGWSIDDRCRELDAWIARQSDSDWRHELVRQVLQSVVRERAAETMALRQRFEARTAELDRIRYSLRWRLLSVLPRVALVGKSARALARSLGRGRER
jgi:glycosyltransferase involved in cell wall biosynthesis